MATHVFILGAGASVESGPPLMKDFLWTARDLLKQKTGGFVSQPEGAGELMELLPRLQRLHAKANLDLENIEELFGVLELARLTGHLEGWNAEDIARHRDALVSLLARTVEATLRLPVSGKKVLAPRPYEALVSHLKRLGDCAVITFNYDLGLDYALYREGLGADYGLPGSSGTIRLLKLHGSINWSRCPKCGQIVPYTLEKYFSTRQWMFLDEMPYVRLDMIDQLTALVDKEGHQVDGLPAIIPPSWNKTEYHQMMGQVWTAAGAELRTAESVYVAGYSLPASDYFFRFLYSVGIMSDFSLRRFWVFDPDPSVGDRFRSLLGQTGVSVFKQFELNFSGLTSQREWVPLLQVA